MKETTEAAELGLSGAGLNELDAMKREEIIKHREHQDFDRNPNVNSSLEEAELVSKKIGELQRMAAEANEEDAKSIEEVIVILKKLYEALTTGDFSKIEKSF